MLSIADITRAADILRTGGLVAFPTETVYGLGACAFDERAVARVFEVKNRPRFDPLIVHVADRHWVPQLVTEFPEPAERLAERFWPGPLTLVLPKTALVPDLVTAGCATVALRIPDHPVAQALLTAADVPVAAPSANPFGRVSPTTAAHVREQLGDRIDLILDGGSCRVGIESTVLQLTPDGPLVLRFGGTTVEEIEELIGPVRMAPSTTSANPPTGLISPGALPMHYAPQTRLHLRESPLAASEERGGASACRVDLPDGPDGPVHACTLPAPTGATSRCGLLAFNRAPDAAQFACVEILSPGGDLREATARFFAALRRLDAAGLNLIVADLFPDVGLGRALNDRLRRAAST